MIKENVSVLMALLQQHCFKKQTSRMGKQVFWVSVQSCAGCFAMSIDAPTAGAVTGSRSNTGRGASCGIVQPRSRQLCCHPLCHWSCGCPLLGCRHCRLVSLMAHRQAVSFESCPVPFLFTRKIRLLYGTLEVRMVLYPKQFWCVSSVCCVRGCAAMHITVNCVKSGNGGVLSSLEQDFNA